MTVVVTAVKEVTLGCIRQKGAPNWQGHSEFHKFAFPPIDLVLNPPEERLSMTVTLGDKSQHLLL